MYFYCKNMFKYVNIFFLYFVIHFYRFLNENAELVFNGLKESYEKGLNKVFQDVSNKIFDKVPMNKIFLEN